MNKSLSQAYAGKVFVIRNFWQGDYLLYDSAGQKVGEGDIGFWTTDGLVQVKKIVLAQNGVRLECKRLLAVSSPDGLNYKDGPKGIDRRDILIKLNDASPSLETVEGALSKIFLTDQDEFFSELPDYWKKCLENSSKQTGSSNSQCHLNPRISSLFAPPRDLGATTHETPSQPAPTSLPASPPEPVLLKPGSASGISPPKLLYYLDPEYSRAAQLAALQGVCVLSVKVDSDGIAKNITIARPLGFGLDEQAIAAVAHWKFDPARKSGEPVAVMINVEVQFRMH